MKKAPNSRLSTTLWRNPIRYWIELAVLENTLLGFDPIRRIVPTTRTRITASITAYSAISCPASSRQILRINSDMIYLSSQFSVKSGTDPNKVLDDPGLQGFAPLRTEN